MAKYQSRAARLSDALEMIDEGLSVIADLADEMESWRDNMSGTNLESTGKYETVGECADVLSTARDDIENTKGELEGVEFPTMFG